MITVVNIRYRLPGSYEYCGRENNRSFRFRLPASPLANPFKLRDEADRDRVLARYRQWFYSQIEDGAPDVADELARLLNLAKVGDLALGCYCAPKSCHCDVIRDFLLDTIVFRGG